MLVHDILIAAAGNGKNFRTGKVSPSAFGIGTLTAKCVREGNAAADHSHAGAVPVWRQGELVRPDGWPTQKCKTVLKVLPTERGRVVPQERLIERIWPDRAPDSASSSLHVAVSQLARTPEPDLAGGAIRNLDGELVTALNLTPGGELAGWTEADFITALRTGVTPGGRMLSDDMPWNYVGQMTDDELKAVWLYLQSLPAREQGLERTDL